MDVALHASENPEQQWNIKVQMDFGNLLLMTDLHSIPRRSEKFAMQYQEVDRLLYVNLDIMVPELYQNGYWYIICYISLVRVWAMVTCQNGGQIS